MGAELRHLTVCIDTDRWSETVVDSVDLAVPDGRITALTGGPGAGKSMTVAALTGVLPAAATCSGEVLVDGLPVTDRAEPPSGHTVGYAPQEGASAFRSDASVGDQLRDLERGHGRWSVDRACRAARFPVEKLDLSPSQLSGGEATRAALAAALIPAPVVLVADEPTASLDAGLKVAVWRTLRAYADAGAAVLAVTNDLEILDATGVADAVVAMEEGRVVAVSRGGTTAVTGGVDNGRHGLP